LNKKSANTSRGMGKAWHRRKNLISDVLFWLVIYGYYVSTTWPSYDNKLALVEKLIVKTGLQILLSYVIILILIPYLLHKGQKVLFFLGGLLSVYLTYVIYTAYRHFYFDSEYPGLYKAFDFYERISDFLYRDYLVSFSSGHSYCV
jgi:hypothetical protein